MENTLAEYLVEKLSNLSTENRFLLAIAGIPGSGKTTLAKKLEEYVNELVNEKVAITVPMDGYHIPKRILNTWPNVDEAYARRGAHWTFDAEGLYQLVISVRNPINHQTIISAPSFDHAIGDPIDDNITILPSHKLVIFEGAYLHLEEPRWTPIASIMDELWFLEVDREIARRRLIERHINSGISDGEESATNRVVNNDLLNADYILNNSITPTRTINIIDQIQ